MRIAFIGQKGIPAVSGGVEKHVENVAVRMAQAGHDVFVYVRSHYTNDSLKEYKGVKLVHVPSIKTKNLDAIVHTLFSTLHALFQGYDVIHYQSVGPTTMSFIPRLLLWKTKVVATFHCQDSLHKKWGWFARKYLQFGEYVACTIPHKTIVVSSGLQEYAMKQYNRKAVLIPNGADVETHIGKDLLSQFGLEEKKYILSVGRLVKHKGVHYLVNAFGKLEDTHKLPKNFKLVIVGKNAETPEYEAYLKMMSKGRNNVVFLGEQTGANLQQLFANAYLFVQPSESEGMSIALLEAMGYGLTSIVSNIDANVEVIGHAGIIFENKNILDLQTKIAYCLKHSDEVARIGIKAQRRIAEMYSWNAIAKQTIQLYQGLFSRSLSFHESRTSSVRVQFGPMKR